MPLSEPRDRDHPRAGLLTRTFLTLETFVADPSDMYFGFHLRMNGTPPELATLRAQVSRRVQSLPLLTHRLTLRDGHTYWEPDADFAVEHHVRHLADRTLDPRPAQALLDTPPPPDRPRWGLWLQTDGGEGWALCFLAHHAVQDATSMLHTLRVLLGPRPAHEPPPSAAGPAHAPRQKPARDLLALLPDVLATYLPHTRSPAPDPLQPPRRELAHASVDLGLLQTMARATGATVNQVHLAAMAAALRDWPPTQDCASQPWWRRGPYVLVPVDTRPPHHHEDFVPHLANRLGLLRIPLPCTASNTANRLTALMNTTSRRHMARHRDALRTLTEDTPDRVASWVLQRLTDPRSVAMTASHVRTQGPVSVLGAHVADITAIPWLPPSHNCFTLLTTHDGVARLSALTTTAHENPQRLVELWADALAE
ncbi:WS/DGAT domain-containing protein [Streptomyces griseobrunneus]